VTFVLEKKAHCFTRWTLYEAHYVLRRLSHFIQAVKLLTFIPNVLCSNHGRYSDTSNFPSSLWAIVREVTQNYGLERFLSHPLQFFILKSPNYSTV